MRTSRSFDPALAVSCAQLVDAAYWMFENDKSGSAQPNPPSPFVAGYEFVAWVQMIDFPLPSYVFYGLIAQSTMEPTRCILAIRGTDTVQEMLEDLTAVLLVDWENFGKVGFGFAEIYRSMRIVTKTFGAEDTTQSLERAPTFAHQVAAAIQSAAAARQAPKVERDLSAVVVTGHSLGAALVTLHVAQSVHAKFRPPQLICTFGSPMVADSEFVKNFNRLKTTSWRIENEYDPVADLPPAIWGFKHIGGLHLNKMTKEVRPIFTCFHHIKTYEHLLDPKQPLAACCKSLPLGAVPAPMRARLTLTRAVAGSSSQAGKEVAVSVPRDEGATINITIKVGRIE